MSTDGQLRVYEAPDVMNLSQWSLMVRVYSEPHFDSTYKSTACNKVYKRYTY